MNDNIVDTIILEEENKVLREENNKLKEENGVLKLRIDGLKELLKSEEEWD